MCRVQVIAILAVQLEVSPAMVAVRMHEHMGLPPLPRSPASVDEEVAEEEASYLSPTSAPVMRAWCRKCRIYNCLTHPDVFMPR